MSTTVPGPARRLHDALSARFLGRLVRSPRGHAFLLNSLLAAEEADEKGVFDRLLERVDDPELHKLVRVHRDDELRHARLLRERMAQAGVPFEPLPAELQIVPYIDRALGGVGDGFVGAEQGVMEAYLLLQVLEERAVDQYPVFARALAEVDPETAALVLRITEDETRHVKYARAISRRYAPDPRTLETTLARFRAAEARAYDENGRVVMRHVLSQDLLDLRGLPRLLLRGLVAVIGLLAPLPPAVPVGSSVAPLTAS